MSAKQFQHPRKSRNSSQCIYVPKPHLFSSTDNAFHNALIAISGPIPWRVRVECNPYFPSDSVFYAPFASDNSPCAPGSTVPAEFLTVLPDPTKTAHLVCSTDDFSVSFVGMHVPPLEPGSKGQNERLLYSIKETDRGKSAISRQGSGGFSDDMSSLSSTSGEYEVYVNEGMESHRNLARPELFFSDSAPIIHYDPVADGNVLKTAGETFLPVTPSKALLEVHEGATAATHESVTLRFRVLDVDGRSKPTAAARKNKKREGRKNRTFASLFGRHGKAVDSAITAITSHKTASMGPFVRPGHVMAGDCMFHLYDGSHGLRIRRENDPGFANKSTDAQTDESGDSNDAAIASTCGKERKMLENGMDRRLPVYAGNFLRYGYYFFLGHKVDAKLYSQISSSDTTVRLMMRRTGRATKLLQKGERDFFPLSGVSYVVLKVTPGVERSGSTCSSWAEGGHLNRIEEILARNK